MREYKKKPFPKPKIPEVKVYGYHACENLWQRRPQDIIRVYIDESCIRNFSPLLKWCAEKKKAYHIIPAEEMEKVTDTVHHEGICILALQPKVPTFEELIDELPRMGKIIGLVYLDDVQNPHNLGSILRICSHFGVPYILGDAKKMPKLTGSSFRIAKGGAETVSLIPLENPKKALKQMKRAGFNIVACSSHAERSLYQYQLHPRTLFTFGSETSGISPDLMNEADVTLTIPGSGDVESLNVAIASAVCLGEFWRQSYGNAK